MRRILNLTLHQDRLDYINNSSKEDFIIFAKNFNIFQQSNNKIYNELCDLIKQRLNREGLSYETVRPD